MTSYSETEPTSEDSFRPSIVDQIIEKFGAEIVNELNTRVILKIDKSLILDCIEVLKDEK